MKSYFKIHMQHVQQFANTCMQKVYKALYKVGRHVNEMLNYNTFNMQGAAVHANPHPSSTTH